MFGKSFPNPHRHLLQRNNDHQNRQVEDVQDQGPKIARIAILKGKGENPLQLVTEPVHVPGLGHVIVVIGDLGHEIVEDLDHVIAGAGDRDPDRGIERGDHVQGIVKMTAKETLLLIL